MSFDTTTGPSGAIAGSSSDWVCLSIVVPAHAEDRLIDFLLSAPADSRIEFSMHAVAARGPFVAMQPGEEEVRGFASRVEATLLLSDAECSRVLPNIRELLSGTDGGYWLTPVLAAGRFRRAG